MAFINFLRYGSQNDFDPSMNKESKPAAPLSGGNGLIPLIKGRMIDEVSWLGENEKRVILLNLMLNDGSSILINQSRDGITQVIYEPPSKR